MNDLLFLTRLKGKDRSAFTELVERYRDQVYNVALGLLHHAGDAEDISQEVFIEVFHSVSSFRGDSELSTWIYRITIQKSLEMIRRSNRKKRLGNLVSLFGRENLLSVDESTPFFHPGVMLENKERAAILFSAINRLPLNQRTAFILHKTEGISYAGIAEILGVSLSSVESLMFRAKQNLQRLLSDYHKKNEE